MNYLRFILGVIFISFLVFVLYIKNYSPIFIIEKSIDTNIPTATLYEYINNNHNWSEWNPWIEENTDVKITHKESSSIYPILEWESKSGNGVLRTTSTSNQNQIIQEISIKELICLEIKWNITEKNDKKLELRIKGEMNFLTKIHALLSGGLEDLIEPYSAKALRNIDRNLQSKLKQHRFEFLGEVLLPKQYHLSLSYKSKEEEQDSLLKLGTYHLLEYARKQNIETTENIFTINPVSNSDKKFWTIGLPIERYHNPQDSLIKCNSKNVRKSLKGIHHGVYENLNLSWSILYKEIELLNPEIRFFPVKIREIGPETSKNPLEWQTELYLPYK
tara:strand:- start:1664 stop:2659 length:996 start_codon:yes stop_codon:yes gene_type:complete